MRRRDGFDALSPKDTASTVLGRTADGDLYTTIRRGAADVGHLGPGFGNLVVRLLALRGHAHPPPLTNAQPLNECRLAQACSPTE